MDRSGRKHRLRLVDIQRKRHFEAAADKNEDDTGEPTTQDKPITASEPNKSIDVKFLPKCSTQYIQPLDLYFFRQYKQFIKDITHFVRLRNIEWALLNRTDLNSKVGPVRPDNRYFMVIVMSPCR